MPSLQSLTVGALAVIVMAGCDGTAGIADAEVAGVRDATMSMGASQNYDLVDLRVQGFTIGPNGEILNTPDCYELEPMPPVKVVIKDGISQFVRREKEKRCPGSTEPYDGGSIDVWAVGTDGTLSFLGHLRANLNPIEFEELPDVVQLRIEASPETARFLRWEGTINSTDNPLHIAPGDAALIRGVFTLQSSGGGGGGGDDHDPCIIC